MFYKASIIIRDAGGFSIRAPYRGLIHKLCKALAPTVKRRGIRLNERSAHGVHYRK